MFGVYNISIDCPLVSATTPNVDIFKSYNTVVDKLKAFKKLSEIEEFANCFEIGLLVYAKDFDPTYNTMSAETTKMCVSLIKNNLDSFSSIHFEANLRERYANIDAVKEQAKAGNPNEDPIFRVMHEIIDEIGSDQISTQTLRLQNVDRKYLHLFLGCFHFKFLKRRSTMKNNLSTVLDQPKPEEINKSF